jgi:hypothetical protein
MRSVSTITHDNTSPKQFAKDGKDIVDSAYLERFINKAKRHQGGMHAEAIDWWKDTYNEFRAQNWFSLQQCDDVIACPESHLAKVASGELLPWVCSTKIKTISYMIICNVNAD